MTIGLVTTAEVQPKATTRRLTFLLPAADQLTSCVAEAVPPGLEIPVSKFHKQVSPADAAPVYCSVVDSPTHKLEGVAVNVAVGIGFTVTGWVETVDSQP